MMSWMRINGSKLPKVDIKYVSKSNRGVVASWNIEKGEVILFVPNKIIIQAKSHPNNLDELMKNPDFKANKQMVRYNYLET